MQTIWLVHQITTTTVNGVEVSTEAQTAFTHNGRALAYALGRYTLYSTDTFTVVSCDLVDDTDPAD